MSNRLEMSIVNSIKKLRQQGWSFVKIAGELGVHRSTVAKYAREGSAADADSADSKSTEVHAGSTDSKPTELHTGSSDPSRSICEPFRETILKKLEQGLSSVRIHQDLVDEHEFPGSYYSVMRFVRRQETATPLPFRRIETAPAEEAQVDFGTGARVLCEDGRRRKTHLFRIVLSYSRKAYSEAVYRQTTENFIRAIENAFWHFGGLFKHS